MLGGPPAVAPGAIASRWPVVTDDDIAAVTRLLRDGRLSWIDNQEVRALEAEWAQYVGVDHCIAVNSGTAALHAAVAATGIEPGDEVIVPALSFLASATSVLHHQGIPVFADVDADTFTVDPVAIEACITPRTRAIVAVHLHGLPADMDTIMQLGARHGLKVIEDAAQAPGARYKGRAAGAIGHMGAFSIMAGKNLPTAGEGGLFTTDDPALRDRADMLKMFGERLDADGGREYNALTLGWNYRLSSVLAAFARTQLRRLDHHTAAVQTHARYLAKELAGIPGITPPYVPPDRTHVYHHFRVKLDPRAAGVNLPDGVFRRAVQQAMAAEGVMLQPYQTQPLPGQELFRARTGYGKGCPWTCGVASRDVTYEPRGYPRTQDVIRTSLVVGSRLCMATFLDRSNVDRYLDALAKVFRHLDELETYGRRLVDDELSDQPAGLF